MKKLLLILLSLPLLFSSCKKEEDEVVTTTVINGCTDANATNYNSSATNDDGSCTGACIGCLHQGGIVFYLNANGGGLIAAPSDSLTGDTTALWGCYSDTIAGANGTAIGTGLQNTTDIELGCSIPGTAADICANLTLGGYNDWFLPSKDELNEMYLNLRCEGRGGLDGGYYWSSTEYDSGNAWLQTFYDTSNNFQAEAEKSITHSVRAIRAF